VGANVKIIFPKQLRNLLDYFAMSDQLISYSISFKPILMTVFILAVGRTHKIPSTFLMLAMPLANSIFFWRLLGETVLQHDKRYYNHKELSAKV